MKHLILLIILACSPLIALCQQGEQKKINAIEAQREVERQADFRMLLDSAIRLSESGSYQAADERFKQMLGHLKSIPSDFVFHFGNNSFYLGYYGQAVDWLNKYIQLKGTSGQYSETAVATLKLAEAELVKEKQTKSREAGEILSQDYNIDCGPTGKVTCPVCRGSTVIVKRGYLGDTYRTCPYCNEHGTLGCDDYNKLIRGELKPSDK